MCTTTSEKIGATSTVDTQANGANGQQQAQGNPVGSGSEIPKAAEPSTSTAKNGSLKTGEKQVSKSKGKSLQQRGQIPPSLYLTVGSVLLFLYFADFWRVETFQSLSSSVRTSSATVVEFLGYSKQLAQSTANGVKHETDEYLTTAVVLLVTLPTLYVFFVAPFMAGLWTGERARKHMFHRYMGLLYMVQYFLAWVEFVTNYQSAKDSYLPITITINGLLQGLSAYISFKVLPELDDAGYISDKAVVSRNFIHENIYFTLKCFQGSVYYNAYSRQMIRSSPWGRILEFIFIFWPYVLIRPWFPITRFIHAGQTNNGRSERNMTFYQISTILVKVFYLWAKYFLGFYMEFMIFLNLPTEKDWRFMHGLLLLNIGTVSLAIFLHTLRFKKVLPPRLTFSIYLLQIYATFSAIPFAYDLFVPHPKLCAVALAGLLCNMTRDRKVHAVWCFCTMALLNYDKIEW